MNYKRAIEKIKSERKNKLLLYEQLFVNALKSNPELHRLEKEIYSLKSAKNNDDPIDEARLLQLEDNKKEIIKHLGLEPPFPDCPVCGDSGLKNGKPCSCVIKMLTPSETFLHSFEDCDFSAFSPNDLPAAKNAYTIAKSFCAKFPFTNTLNLIILGKVGTGKTFLASCIANELDKKGFSAVFCSAFNFVNRGLSYHTAPAGEKLEHIAPLIDCDLLIIDDLGTESMLKNVTVEYFYNILNERMYSHKHTLITTNLDDVMLAGRYGERVASRLFDKRCSMGFTLSSSDLRKK